MDRNELLEVANYPLRYPGLWALCATFTDRFDESFPLDDCVDVDVLSYLGEPLEDCFTTIVAGDSSPKGEEEAYAFALTLALNGISVSVASTRGSLVRAIRGGMLDGGGRMELYVDLPLTGIMEKPALRALASNTLVNGGTLISPFSPDGGEGDAWSRHLLNLHLASQRRNIIVMGCRKSELEVIESSLDGGSEVFVHSSFLSSACARMLAMDGAPLIDSAAGYLEKIGLDCHCRLYPDEKGAYRRGGGRWFAFRY